VLVSKHREVSMLSFGIDIVAVPVYYVVFILLAELMKSMHLVLDNLLTRA